MKVYTEKDIIIKNLRHTIRNKDVLVKYYKNRYLDLKKRVEKYDRS